MKIKKRIKINKGYEKKYIIMKIKRRIKMNKGYENENMFFFSVCFIQNKKLNIYKYWTYSRYN